MVRSFGGEIRAAEPTETPVARAAEIVASWENRPITHRGVAFGPA